MATARTVNEWSPVVTQQNKFMVWSTTLVMNDNGESDIFTKRTPKELDPDKPFELIFYASNTPDGSALPVKLWGGWADNFALAGDTTTVAATNGVAIKQIMDNCVTAITTLPFHINFDPDLPVAEVVAVASIASGFKVRPPKFPFYIFHFDGASTLTASITYTLYLIQKKY